MVGQYVRKSERQSWKEEDMVEALNAVKNNQMGWLLASKTFNVPHTTLRRRAKNHRGSGKGYLGGHVPTFDVQLENELVRHVKELEVRFFGLTTLDIRRLAYEIADVKKIPNRFSKEKKMAGWDWLKGFRKRNPSISLRTPEATSSARARAFNKVQIGKYFNNLEKVLDEHKFSPENIFNMDESGLSTVPSRNSKILATKGRKQVGVLTSAERGQHLTIVCCFNAIGTYVPPVLLFPRKNMKYELMDHAPVGALGLAQESGWMTGETFLKYLKHFVKYVKPSVANKVLLLLDGHSSHKNFEALTYAKDNGIVIFCFPPHCTHRVQPLDVCFFGSLMTYYNQELFRWLKSNPGRTVTHFQVGGILKEAYNKAATIENAVKAFSKTGIYPLNKDIFPDWMFQPAEVTNQQENLTATEINEFDNLQPSVSGCSNGKSDDSQPPVSNDIRSQSQNISIQDISPLPVSSVATKNRKPRKGGKYGVLNNTPEIEIAKAAIVEKEAATLRKSARAAKRKLVVVEESEEEIEGFPLEDHEEDDAACLYCNDLYSFSRLNEDWIRCQKCNQWCHSECAGVNKRVKQFTCDVCN